MTRCGRELIKKSAAYGIIERERDKGALSHAYLIVCQDGLLLRSYLKYIAALILSSEGDLRADRLILDEIYTDCSIYPQSEKSLGVSDVNDIVENSIIKPLENRLRLFVLSDCQSMTAQAQNKLLKTLEEPPQNVVLLLGTTKEAALLSTVKSRVKILEIPPFSTAEIAAELEKSHPGVKDLRLIAAAAEGQLGRATALISDNDFLSIRRAAYGVAENLNTVKDIAGYSAEINAFSKKLKEFLSILKIVYRDILMYKCGCDGLICDKTGLKAIEAAAERTDEGALLSIIGHIGSAEEDLFYNANAAMQIERLLVCILEEKYKWQRL